MNCSDIARLLDEDSVAELPRTSREQAEAHIAGCADCAEQWLAAGSLDGFRSETPPLPAALAARIRNLEELAGSKPVPDRSRRPLIFGSLLLLGAAATMYAAVPWRDAGPAGR